MNIHKALKRIEELGGIFSQTKIDANDTYYQFSVEIPAGVCGMKRDVVFRAKRHNGYKRNRIGKDSYPIYWGYTFWQKDWDWDTHLKGHIAKNKTEVLEHFIRVMEKCSEKSN